MTKNIRTDYDPEKHKWKKRPELPVCSRGNQREWHIDGVPRTDKGTKRAQRHATGITGNSYQNQLYCRHWQKFINPSGFTCELCEARVWPEVENYRAHLLPPFITAGKQKEAGEALVRAVTDGQLAEDEALQLAKEFDLG